MVMEVYTCITRSLSELLTVEDVCLLELLTFNERGNWERSRKSYDDRHCDRRHNVTVSTGDFDF